MAPYDPAVPPAPDAARTPHCPACGYDRTGLATGARCPECGAEGVEAAVVVVGRVRGATATIAARVLMLVPQLLILAAFTRPVVARLLAPNPAPFTPLRRVIDPLEAVVILVLLGLIIVQLWFLIRRAMLQAGLGAAIDQVVWSAFPSGLEIRTWNRRDWIPREAIARIHCSDSVLGRSSQLLVGFHVTHRLGIVGRTHILFIDGPKDERRARWRSLRGALGLEL